MTSSQPPQDEEPAGAVRHYYSPAEAAQYLGITRETFRSRIRIGYYAQVLADAQPGDIVRTGRDRGYSTRVLDLMSAVDAQPDDPARLGGDLASLPDDMLIGPKMWAVLQGVTTERVWQQLREARIRRVQGTAEPRDMPEPQPGHGRRLRWSLGAYRTWREANLGREAGHGGRRWSTRQPRL